jgi:hypothetical protein
MMVYKLVGRCDLNRRNFDSVNSDMMDWLWLLLSPVPLHLLETMSPVLFHHARLFLLCSSTYQRLFLWSRSTY